MKSMTGFGSEELNKDGLNLKITARSLNDKYLNIRCKTPPDFPEFVSYKIERMIPKLLSRGTIYIPLPKSMTQKSFWN